MICIIYILRNQDKYIKKLLWMVSYIFQDIDLEKYKLEIIEKSNYKTK
jgi:uncharacterized membrane protein YhdT